MDHILNQSPKSLYLCPMKNTTSKYCSKGLYIILCIHTGILVFLVESKWSGGTNPWSFESHNELCHLIGGYRVKEKEMDLFYEGVFLWRWHALLPTVSCTLRKQPSSIEIRWGNHWLKIVRSGVYWRIY